MANRIDSSQFSTNESQSRSRHRPACSSEATPSEAHQRGRRQVQRVPHQSEIASEMSERGAAASAPLPDAVADGDKTGRSKKGGMGEDEHKGDDDKKGDKESSKAESKSKRPSAQLYDPSQVLKSTKSEATDSDVPKKSGGDERNKGGRRKHKGDADKSEKAENTEEKSSNRGNKRRGKNKKKQDNEAKGAKDGKKDNNETNEGKDGKDSHFEVEDVKEYSKTAPKNGSAKGGSNKSGHRSKNSKQEKSGGSIKKESVDNKGAESTNNEKESSKRNDKKQQQSRGQQQLGRQQHSERSSRDQYQHRRGNMDPPLPPRMRNRQYQQHRLNYNEDDYEDCYDEEMSGPVASRVFSRSYRRSNNTHNWPHFNNYPNDWREDTSQPPRNDRPRTPPFMHHVDHWRSQPQWPQPSGQNRRGFDTNNSRTDEPPPFGVPQHKQIRPKQNLPPRLLRKQQQDQLMESLKRISAIESVPSSRTRSPPSHRQLWNPNEPPKRPVPQHQAPYPKSTFNQPAGTTSTRQDYDHSQVTNDMRNMSLGGEDAQHNQQQQQVLTEPQPPLMSDWSVEVEEEEERKMEEQRRSMEKETKNESNVRPNTTAVGGQNQIKLSSGLTFIRPQIKRSVNAWSGDEPVDPRHQEDAKRDLPMKPNSEMATLRTATKSQQEALQEAWSQHQATDYSRQQQGIRVDNRGNQHPGALRPPFQQQRLYLDNRVVFPEPPAWYDLNDARIYTPEHQRCKNIIGRLISSDMDGLRPLIRDGGVAALLEFWDRDVLASRKEMERAFEHLLRTDLAFCVQHDVEFNVWKIAFYLVLETLKFALEQQRDSESRQRIIGRMVELINEGTNFYESMLDVLCKVSNLDIKAYLDPLEPRPTDKSLLCVLISAQKCLLCLGDLSRYRENLKSSNVDLSLAKQYYQQARNVEPRNSRPYNQLALLASMARRKFDIVYYHIRCLSASNPIPASKQGLTVVLEECLQRWQVTQKRRLEEKELQRREEEREKESSMLIKGSNLRKEIWIRPEGGHRLFRTTSACSEKASERQQGGSYETQLRSMEQSEVNRCFVSTYLSLIATLYSNVNFESFGVALEILLLEFRVLVDHCPLGIEAKGLTQIMAINMFIIEFTGMKEGDAQKYRSVLQTSALQLAFDMFAIIVARCNSIIDDHYRNSGSSGVFPDDNDLSSLLSGVKIWCDWMLGNNDTWNPVISEEPFLQLAKLATHLETLKVPMTPIISQFVDEKQFSRMDPRSCANFKLIRLPEDAMLCGFKPWARALDWEAYRRYAPIQMFDKLATDVRRMDAINLCVLFLEGLEKPILKYSLPDSAHISLVEERLNPQERVNARLKRMLASNEEVLEETYSDDEQSNTSHQHQVGSMEVSKLKQRRDELEHRHREEQRIQQEILRDHVSLILEIHPHLLVPDTNCFVDHLDHIRALASSTHFRVCVPLTVIHELEGLSKGSNVNKNIVKERPQVMERARQAMTFLMDGSTTNMKCVTTSGKYLTSMRLAGASEDLSMYEQKSNDDLILETCLNLPTSNVPDRWREEKDGRRTRCINRQVVLITDDRNLKLKAHIQDMPVISIKDFVNWAKP